MDEMGNFEGFNDILNRARDRGYYQVTRVGIEYIRFERPEPRLGLSGGIVSFCVQPRYREYSVWWNSSGWRDKPGGYVKYWIWPVTSIAEVLEALNSEDQAISALIAHSQSKTPSSDTLHTPQFTEPVSDEAIKRISGEAIDLAIERHSLLVWNHDGEHLTREEIEEIKQDVFTAMTTPEPPPLIRDISERAK